MAWRIIVCILAGYALGNLNGAIITSKLFHQEDVREKGSGNAGLTNFFRNYGGLDTLLVIVIIDPKSGEVEATIDCSGLLPRALRKPETDVLNGIAYDPATKKTYLTGKYWPKLYEVVLKEK